LVAAKDLRVELRSRVATNQVVPFALLVLVLFAFALDPDRGVLTRVAAGLFWVTVLFSAVLAIQRSFAIEADDDARDALRLSGLDGAGIFLGKAAAVAVQLVCLEAVLAAGVAVLYDVALHGRAMQNGALLALICVLATVGIAAAGIVYGVVAAGLRVRDTLLPLLVLPVLAPVLLAATRASEAALAAAPGDAWPWVRLLAVFATIYTVFGVVAFGPLLEEA
jgi:heme exporter protein B